MQQLTKQEVMQVSGGMIDAETLFLASMGILGGVMGVCYTPFSAPNAATQIMMVAPFSFSAGALALMLVGGTALAAFS